tara:strand:- start:262 stop:687 length:426 start_codon:yes stop_codon:yes gene_type:complete
MTSLFISIKNIEPAPQGSKRHIGGGRMIEVSKRVKPWRKAVSKEAVKKAKAPIEGACKVEMIFRFNRPKSHYRLNGTLKQSAPEHLIVKKNDLDKLVRSTLDALTNIAFKDDSQVTNLSATKKYCNEEEEIGADILIQVVK